MADDLEVEIMIKVRYPIPRDERLRQTIYGTTDLRKCVEIDFENDPMALLADSDSEIVSVQEASHG